MTEDAEPSQPKTPQPASSGSRPKMWQPPTAVELQSMLPDYEITLLLGRGGMGAVYKGVQRNLDRPVAIKILPPDLADAEGSYADRFRNEAMAMARMNHYGIVKVYDFGEVKGLLYFVMEFIEGTDVSRMIARKGRLPADHALAITAHVCDALYYAHERGIIHRDIKPANIMVGQDGVVKVADFGLAKMAEGGHSGLTRSGMAMGTLHYMAPEALTLGTAVDHRADIYAVGVMFYHMLAGRLPQGVFEPLHQQFPELDPRYDDIVARAMRDDRELRYPSAAALRADLDSLLTRPVMQVVAEERTPATPPTAGHSQQQAQEPEHDPSKNHWQHSPPPAPRSGRHWLPWAALLIIGGVIAWLLRPPSEPAPETTITTPAPPFTNSLGMKFVSVPGTDAEPPKKTTPLAETKPKAPQPPSAAPAPSEANAAKMPVNAPAPAKSATSSPAQAPPASTALAKPATTDKTPASSTHLSPSQTWTDLKGRTITATFKAIASGNVLLEIAGKITPVPLNTLSSESQQRARSLHATTSSTQTNKNNTSAKSSGPPAKAPSVVSAVPKPELLRIISMSPQTPATLALGEKFSVQIGYINSGGAGRPVRVFFRPVITTREKPSYSSHGCTPLAAANGEKTGWFSFSEQAKLRKVRIEMIDAETRELIHALELPVVLEWK
jgi:serine/threonine protein kinase